jgi:hypothetical protein
MIKEKALLPTRVVVPMEVMGWLATSWEVFLHHKTEAAKEILDSFRSIKVLPPIHRG